MTSPLTQDVSDLRPAAAEQPVAACARVVKGAGRYRWKICALLFFAATLNYMDRQVLALLKPVLQNPVRGIGLTEVQFAAIVSIFSAAYALGLLLAGTFVDKVGTRVGYAVAVMVWTLASMSHSLVAVPAVGSALHSAAVDLASILRHVPGLESVHWVGSMADLSGAVIGFGIVRFALGLGEAGNFPSAIKAVAEWFPTKERALATGIFNSGTNIGATLAPFAVGFLLYKVGWQYAFLGTSAFALIGFVLQITHGNYVPVFLLAGSAYLIAIGIIQLLAPKLSVVAIDSPRSTLVSGI